VLCGISFLLNGIAIIINHDSIQNKITFPKSFVSWIFCSLTFIFSAFFEETIYRLYLPETLKDLLKSDSKLLLNKTEIYAVEIFTALIFALSHRYAGIFSVINALLAHIVLRICQKKSLSIYAGFVAHFAYNMISLLLLSMN
jgi:membrane protease YdiL (CAAX protease family)